MQPSPTRSRTRPAIGVAALGAAIAVPLLIFGGTTAQASDDRLEPFRSCDDFASLARQRALEALAPIGGAVATGRAEAQSGADLVPGQRQLHAGTDYSTTNVQEAGIDEPDLVKSDGRRTFAIAAGRVYAIDTAQATARVTGSAPLPRGLYAREMLLAGDRLLVIADGPAGVGEPGIGANGRIAWGGTTFVEIDVRDPASMRLGETISVDAGYASARLSGTTARVVLNSNPLTRIGAAASTTDELRARIGRAGADDFIPHFTLRDRRGATSSGTLIGCADMSHPAHGAGIGILSIVTMDLSQGIRPTDTDGLLAEGYTVMASPRRIYVALTRSDVEDRTIVAKTEIHAFDTTTAGRTAYVASGAVLGGLLNQFSMSEHRGRLRIATTLESFPAVPVGPPAVVPAPGAMTEEGSTAPDSSGDGAGGDPGATTATRGATDEPDVAVTSSVAPGEGGRESAVSVLEERDARLVQVGRVAGLGRGERIYAVRFIGPVGYVVTFRQTDPLYTIDLSDPTTPRVVGELKIPGYSAYLHPVDDHTLIGVGQDAAASPDGRFATVQGLQVGLFDVSNPAAPRRTQVWTMPGAYSDAEYDHHALLWWPGSRTLVLPLTGAIPVDVGRSRAPYGSGAVALRVTASGIEQTGLIRHPGSDQSPLRRTVVVNDSLLTFSDAGVALSTLDGARRRQWLPFR